MTYSDGPDEFTIEQVRATHEARGRGHACHDQRGWLLDEWERLTAELGKARREQWNEHLRAERAVDPDPFDALIDSTDDL